MYVRTGSQVKWAFHFTVQPLPEVSGESGVDERVDGRVAVAQPEDDGEREVGHAALAECGDQVHCEEGEPAADEAADDDAQRLRSLGLHAEAADLTLDVALAELVGGCGGCGGAR